MKKSSSWKETYLLTKIQYYFDQILGNEKNM